MSAFGGKTDMDYCAHMAAFDPKRTSAPVLDSRVWVFGVWVKQLLAINLVAGDGLLALRRYQPIDELLSEILLYARMFGRIYQHDAVLVEQPFVVLYDDVEIVFVLLLVPTSNPCGAVR